MRHRIDDRGRYELIAGVGHFLHVERPEIVNRLILDFIGTA